MRTVIVNQEPILGILALETTPDLFPGSLHNSTTFECEVLVETVQDVWAPNILRRESNVEGALIAAARNLQRRGARILTGNCGYMALYVDAIRRATGLPCLISALQQLPLIAALHPRGKIGIATFDSVALTPDYLKAVWPGYRPELVQIEGMEGTSAWRDWCHPEPVYDEELARSTVVDVAAKLKAAPSMVTAILLECEVMSPFATDVRRATGIPTYSLVPFIKLAL